MGRFGKVDTVRMLNGTELPLLGVGSWLATDEKKTRSALCAALDLGFRYIDMAALYENEEMLGTILADYFKTGKLKREDLFLTNKLPIYGHEDPEAWIEQSLRVLQTDYFDLYLLHGPYPVRAKNIFDVHNDPEQMLTIPLIDTWRVIEKYYKMGKFKAIGVCNFSQQQLEDLCSKAEIQPMNHQIELHVYNQQHDLVEFCRARGITVTGYAPIGSPGRLGGDEVKEHFNPLDDPLVRNIAKKYGRSPAQILIRFNYQRRISAIPKSTNVEHVKENFAILDFKLDDVDFNALYNIRKQKRLFLYEPMAVHPWNPYKAELRQAGHVV